MPGKFFQLLIGLLFIYPLHAQNKKNQAYFKGDTSKVTLLISLSEEYSSIDLNKSIEYAKEAISIAEKISYRDGRINAYSNIADIYSIQKEFDQSIHFYTKQLRLVEEKNSPLEVAEVMNNLGVTNLQAKKYKKAAKCFMYSINASRKANNIPLSVTNHNNLGMIYFIMKRYKDAEEQYKSAIKLINNNKEPVSQKLTVVCLLNLLEIYYTLGDSATFDSYFKEAWSISKRMKNQVYYATLINIKSIILLEKGEIKKAEKYALEAHKIMSQFEDRDGQLQNLRQLGTIYFQQENWELSKKYFDTHYQTAKEIQLESELLESHYYLAKLCNKFKKVDSAHFHLKQHVKYRDSIQKQEKEIQIAGIVDSYETLDKATKERAVTTAYNSGLQNRNSLIITLSIFLLLLFIIFNRQRKLVKTQKKEVHQKSKELISYTLSLTQKNNTFRELKKVALESSNDSDKKLTKIRAILRSSIQVDNDWKEFKHRFERVHKDFFITLDKMAPDLTPTEQKVCALLRLSLETKSIASLLNIETTSLHVTRSKIRKKLNLNSEVNLTHFISRIQ